MENLENKETQAPIEENNVDNPVNDTWSEELTKERWKQQLEWSKKEAEKYRQYVIDIEYQKASENANNLLELNTKDPKLANEVAKKFWYDSVETIKKELEKSNTNNNDFTEEKFEELYQKRRAKEEHEQAIKKAENVISQLDEDLKNKAKTYFEKITRWQTLDTETALEFAEMATLYVSKDKLKKDKFDDTIWLLWSSNISSTKPKQSNDNLPVIVWWKLILNSNK